MMTNAYFLRPTNKTTRTDAEWHPFMLWRTDLVCQPGEEVLDQETGRFYVVEEWSDDCIREPEKALALVFSNSWTQV